MKEFFEKVVSDPHLEGRWLNTLSLLEHMGARKISRTVGQDHPSLEILEHHADEVGHALTFKRLHAELANGHPTQDAYLCSEAAIAYFQSLDHTLAEWIEGIVADKMSYAKYLVVTSCIERRAMGIYPLYRDTTNRPNVAEALERIIQEEQNHRSLIDKRLKNLLKECRASTEEAYAIEERFFGQLRNQLRSAVGIASIDAGFSTEAVSPNS